MQTFLPHKDFRLSAACIDNKRLGNQFYREGLTLIRGGWRHHPIARMWEGFHWGLGKLLLAYAAELTERGYHYPKHIQEVKRHMVNCKNKTLPGWLGDPDFHKSHRENLLRKDFDYYTKIFPLDEPSDWYVWIVEGQKYKQQKGNTKVKIYYET